jgi:hypothetical protein
MNHLELTQKVEEIWQARLKNPNSLSSKDPLLFAEWNKYWLDCLSTHNESLYIDLLNRHNIPFVRKAMIMVDGTVLADDDYAAWYFTYPELVESTRRLIWDFGLQRIVIPKLKDSILALPPLERECFNLVCKHQAPKGKANQALLKILIEKGLVRKSKYYVDRKHWLWQYNPDSHLLKEVWEAIAV